jgi:DNA-binding response OmpR family regulator
MNVLNAERTATVLYVENDLDEQAIFRIAHKKMRAQFRVHEVSSVAAAKAYLEAANRFSNGGGTEWPDLIILDFSLTGETGLDLLRWIRQRPEFQDLPVLMFSGFETPDKVQRSYEEGADYFVHKEMGLEKLNDFVRCIDRCLSSPQPSFDALAHLPEYDKRPAGE